MRQRRVKIPATIRSSYNKYFKNYPESAPHKIKPKMSINLDQEHKRNPLRAVSSITLESSIYRNDFDDQAKQQACHREILDDQSQTRALKSRIKRPHVDMEKQAPVPRSTYKTRFEPLEIQDILIEKQPHYPRYDKTWFGDSQYRTANQQMQKSMRDFRDRKIVITEPKRPFQITKPLCPRGRGFFSTEKKSGDNFVAKSLYSPHTRSGMLKASMPIVDPRSSFQIRNQSSFKYEVTARN